MKFIQASKRRSRWKENYIVEECWKNADVQKVTMLKKEGHRDQGGVEWKHCSWAHRMETKKKACDHNNSWSYKWGVTWVMSSSEEWIRKCRSTISRQSNPQRYIQKQAYTWTLNLNSGSRDIHRQLSEPWFSPSCQGKSSHTAICHAKDRNKFHNVMTS